MNRREEHLEKVQRVRNWLVAHGYEAALFTTQSNFSWITAGGEAHVSLAHERAVAFILVSLDRVCLLTNVIEKQRMLEEELAELDVLTRVWPWDVAGGLEQVAEESCNPSKTVTDRPGPGYLGYDKGLQEVRYTLLPAEIQRYQRLGQDAAAVVEGACKRISPGMTELEVAALVAKGCWEHEIVPLVNLIAADERIGLYRHPIPTGKHIRNIAMLALTGRREGLHVSLTRLVAFGNIDHETRRRHDAVTRVDAAYILGSRPSRTLGEVLQDGLKHYESEGFPGEWEHHHQGGLTGYAGREILATLATTHILQVGQCLAWNPSITGTKSEDTIAIGDENAFILTQTDDWPSLEVGLNSVQVRRPDILVR